MLPDEFDVIVVGGGAAGMMASIAAATNGERVLLLEKNEKTGKKIYITGKGRCNFTNACDTEDFFSQVVTNAKFLYSSVYGFSNHAVTEWFTEHGLKVKEERGGRMFPASDHSSDVIKALNDAIDKSGVKVLLNTAVSELITDGDPKKACGVRLENGDVIKSNRVIIATGGISYPSTGSTGDGYRMAKSVGHTVTELRPGLTGIMTAETDVRDCQGLTLINIGQKLIDPKKNGNKAIYKGFGELLFTHFGVSGPTVLSISSLYGDLIKDHPLKLSLDLKPGLDEGQLDKRFIREIESNGTKSLKNLLGLMLPKSFVPVFIMRSGIDPELKGQFLTKENRKALIACMKEFELTLTGLRDFNEAIITRGGVKVSEIDPHTMESKLVKNLYFAGEIIDTDALTGGYNLQIAWSTGNLAGTAGN